MLTQPPLRESICELLSYFDKIGFVRKTYFFRNRENKLPYWSVQNLLRGKTDAHTAVTEGIGSAIARDPELAVLVAISESMERLYLSTRHNNLPICHARELSEGRVLSATEWPTFTAAQLDSPKFPFRRYNPDETHVWARTISLLSGEACWLPAELVWVTHFPNRFMPGISSGSACHTDHDAAILSGLFEVVERDAFTIMWESRAITPLLDPKAAFQSDEVHAISTFFHNLGIRFLLRNLTTDLNIPAVLAVVHDDTGRRPALAIGAASRATFAEACHKAAEEAYHTWTWMTDEHGMPGLTYEETLAILEMPDVMMRHPYLYGFSESVAMVPHLVADAPIIIPHCEVSLGETLVDQLRIIAAHLTRHGYEPLACDLIPRVETSQNPFSVVRVIVPGLVPLSIGRAGRMLENPRIGVVPEQMAWPLDPHTKEVWVPHPFP
jgi:ribosomal protein S12 methylthiotransferase accessory factor